jgi:hypothetical protein
MSLNHREPTLLEKAIASTEKAALILKFAQNEKNYAQEPRTEQEARALKIAEAMMLQLNGLFKFAHNSEGLETLNIEEKSALIVNAEHLIACIFFLKNQMPTINASINWDAYGAPRERDSSAHPLKLHLVSSCDTAIAALETAEVKNLIDTLTEQVTLSQKGLTHGN